MREERQISAVELSERQMRVAMTSPSHLKRWMHESNRRWVVLNGDHLVDALPWPDGVESFMQLVACYRDHRSTLPTGDTEVVVHPETGKKHEVPLYHPETLTVTELDRAIRWMIGQVTALDATWRIENEPL